jgi:hypothetical protein
MIRSMEEFTSAFQAACCVATPLVAIRRRRSRGVRGEVSHRLLWPFGGGLWSVP